MNSTAQGQAREARLEEIRHEAERKGQVLQAGVHPVGSPMPVASPQTGYYQRPLLKEPQWTPLIPLYFFVGGATGALGVIGSLADLLGENAELARKSRWMATAGAALSSVLLIVDLGRPTRFLHMLRVFKPQSPMSVGSWVLSGFSASAALSSLADLLQAESGAEELVSYLRAAGRAGCIVLGMPLHNYTGVLIGSTVIPVWNSRIRSLPREFGVSGLQSAVCLLEMTGETDSAALNAIGLLSAAVESLEGIDLLRTHDRALLPAKHGWSGAFIHLAGVLSGPVPIGLRIASLFVKNKKRMRTLAAVAGIAGSLFLRYGWMRAGTLSSRDWRIPLQIDKPRG